MSFLDDWAALGAPYSTSPPRQVAPTGWFYVEPIWDEPQQPPLVYLLEMQYRSGHLWGTLHLQDVAGTLLGARGLLTPEGTPFALWHMDCLPRRVLMGDTVTLKMRVGWDAEKHTTGEELREKERRR